MKKLLAFSLIGSSFFVNANLVKADYNSWAIKFGLEPIGTGASMQNSGTIEIYNYNSRTGEESLINRFVQANESLLGVGDDGKSVHWRFLSLHEDNVSFDESNGTINFKQTVRSGNNQFIYDVGSNSFSIGNYSDPINPASNYALTIEKPSVLSNSGGGIKVEMNGKKLIEKKSNGAIHIGENSAVFKEEGGREKFGGTNCLLICLHLLLNLL